MVQQIFKKPVPISLLINILNQIGMKDDEGNKYIISPVSFKKLQYNNWLAPFIEQCKEYYHISKYRYIERPHTYKSFVTIIRQLCKQCNVQYYSNIKYDHSNYEIIYTISI